MLEKSCKVSPLLRQTVLEKSCQGRDPVFSCVKAPGGKADPPHTGPNYVRTLTRGRVSEVSDRYLVWKMSLRTTKFLYRTQDGADIFQARYRSETSDLDVSRSKDAKNAKKVFSIFLTFLTPSPILTSPNTRFKFNFRSHYEINILYYQKRCHKQKFI